MWKRQQGRDDRDCYGERDDEPHFQSRDDRYGEDRYRHPDEMGRSHGYEDERRVVQHQGDEYDSYGAGPEYDSRYNEGRRIEENRDERFDNIGKMDKYPDDGYDQYGETRDFPDKWHEDSGRRDGYEGDRFEDRGRNDEWNDSRYDDAYGDRREIPDARDRGDLSGDWNRDNRFELDRYETADDRSLDKPYEYDQQMGRLGDYRESRNMERAANFGRNGRDTLKRDEGRKTVLAESKNKGRSAGSVGTGSRGTATSVKDRLGNRNLNEPNRQEQANRGIWNRSEKDFHRQGHSSRGNVHARLDNKSTTGSKQASPKVESRRKENNSNRPQSNKIDSKQVSKRSLDKSTSVGRRDSSGKGRTSDTANKEKPRSSSSSRKNDPKQGSSRSSSAKQSKTEGKECTRSTQRSSNSDKKNDNKQKTRSSSGDGHQSSRQKSQTEKGVKREKDIKSESHGASRHAERRSTYSSQRSGGSDSKHVKSSLEVGTYHEDDVISILAEDDAFAKESNRLEWGDAATYGHDAPFQIHAESSASIFDDETNTSNRYNDTFKVPSNVRSKDSSNKTKQTSVRNRMAQKKNLTNSKVMTGWRQKQSTKPKIKSFSSSRNRFGNSSRRYGNKGNNKKKPLYSKFSKNTKTQSQGTQGYQAVERSREGRFETGRTGAILREDINVTRNDPVHGHTRHDNNATRNDPVHGHTRHDNRMEENYYQFSNEDPPAGLGHARYDNRMPEDNYYEENPAAGPSHEDPNRWPRDMDRTERNDRDHRLSRERYDEFSRNYENDENYNESKVSRNRSRSPYSRRNQQANDERHAENFNRNQSGARINSDKKNNFKSRGIYQSEKVKKKYRSSGFSKAHEASSGKNKTTSGRGKDSRSKTESRSSRKPHSSNRDKKDLIHQENVQQSGIMPVASNLPMPGVDANQQLIFVPNPDMQGYQPQLIDQFGNVIINPDVGLQPGTAQPMPIQLAQPGMPPEAPPGSEQLIFIPFGNNQMQGYPENVVPVVGSGQHLVSGIQTIDTDKQARLEKSVRPGHRPLTREQRARIRSRLLMKRRARLEKEVEKKLLKKLFDESKAGKDVHSSGARLKPLIKKISPPKSAGAPFRKSLKPARKETKGLEDVSDDENKYEKVSDYEDLTDDESLHGGNEPLKDKRHAFRKPGQPRFGVGANQNIRQGQSTQHIGRSGKIETDVRKVIDRSGNSLRRSNEGLREYSPGRKRQRNVIYEEDNDDLKRPRMTNRSEANKSGISEKETRRPRVYEKRPISPLEITVSNDHFSKETKHSSRQSTYSEENSPRYDRRTNERMMPKEKPSYYDDRNETASSNQYSRRENETDDFGNGNRKYGSRNSQGESRGKYTEHEDSSSRNDRDTGKYGSRYDDRRNKEDYEERNRSNVQRAPERDDRSRQERGNGQAPQSGKRGYEDEYDDRSQDRHARPYNTSQSGSNEKFQRNRREDFESENAIRRENSSGNFTNSQGKSQPADQQLPPAQIVHRSDVHTSQPISYQQAPPQMKMQVVSGGTQFGVDHSQPPVQHGPMSVPPFPSPMVVGPDRSLPPPQGTLIHAQTSMPIILQSQSAAIQGQQQFQSQPLQQQGQVMQAPSQQLQPQSVQQQPFQQQQMSMNNPATGQAVFQTGIQQMHDQQPVFQTGMQSIQAPQKSMQTVQLYTGSQQPQGQMQQPQQSVSGTFVQSSNFQTSGQFQDVQQGTVSRASLNDRLPYSAGAQNVGNPQSRQQNVFVPATPQQAVRGALMNVKTNVGIRAAGQTGNRMPLRQGGGSLALPAGAVHLGSSAPTRSYYKGAGNMPGTAPTSTISRAPGRFESNMNAQMEMEEMADDMGEADFEQDDDLGELLCTKCDKVFLSDRVMRSHNLWHDHMDSGYSDTRCDICEESFLSSGAFNTHIADKHSMNSWNCTKCDITFANSAALARHTKMTHFRQTQTFNCSLCGATFDNMKPLLQHKRILHGEASTFSGTGYTRRYR